MANNGDYYLDVAMAAHFNARPAQMSPDMGQLSSVEVGLCPEMARASLSDEHQLDDYDDYAVPTDENCCRLERSQVELVQLIGEGQKGYVFLGKLQSRSGGSIMDVAIKTLKFETSQLIERLMCEAAMMKQLEHPHIIRFIGMCPETPALIAMELAKFGELKQYLKLNGATLKISQLVLFAFQISTALSYLESKNYVHRDVAARNVLVCSPTCVKLADFGLSRNLLQPSAQQLQLLLLQDQTSAGPFNPICQRQEEQLYVAAPRVKLPVRWLAPESLVFRRFTSASDVWMFAVFVWELFHLGALRPWPQLRNNQVLLAIEAGQRLGRPNACPVRLYQLLLKCWSYAPVQRPKFREIKQSIWSIYLAGRTREQFELEQLERDKRRHHLISCRQEQEREISARLASPSGNQMLNRRTNQQLQTQRYSSNYSSNTLTSTTNTTENDDHSTSPGSSAFGSLARPALGQLELQRQRFQQRRVSPSQPAAAPLSQQRQQRAHVLQKQRSQGAIAQAPPCDNSRSQAHRRHHKRRPLDDGTLELEARQRLYAATLRDIETDEEEDDDDEAAAEEEEARRPVDEEAGERERHRRLLNGAAIRAPPTATAQCRRSLMLAESISPALTVERSPVEPAYEGLQMARRPTCSQVAMLRAKYDPAGPAASHVRQLTSSPALTSARETPASSRPTSWRLSPSARLEAQPSPTPNAAHQKLKLTNRVEPQRVAPQAEQLGQMLQALRITPMKARLRASEQTVRVLEPRHQDSASCSPTPPPPLVTNRNKLPQIHQQPLQSRVQPAPAGSDARRAKFEALGRRHKSAESDVEQSLQLLESLMEPEATKTQAQMQQPAASLQRRRLKTKQWPD